MVYTRQYEDMRVQLAWVRLTLAGPESRKRVPEIALQLTHVIP